MSSNSSRGPDPTSGVPSPSSPSRKVLFLDDDPMRAQIFLNDHPEAIWVQTAVECIARLSERWDEVHLDHDLGGEQFVDHARDDCGMEVVRWICLEPRPHLKRTRFLVHSHNIQAATIMGLQMLANGFKVDVRPFGAPASSTSNDDSFDEEPDPLLGPIKSFFNAVMRLFGRRSREHPYGYVEHGRGDGSVEPPREALDLSWAKRSEFRRAKAPEGVPTPELDLNWKDPRRQNEPPGTTEIKPPTSPS
ncbi:MAG: cyclic-phosphate processing receiver domain-containing protein [Isosphaeraceae bacterium]